ncbi:hypothetical protein [Natranaerobius thermophilus]|uniref:Uncharacterized protein n=1 Tax=Natranaerobius thermophilus (strain ATCC BAA-1301 / DSM 18059 / JW/NM-WN-LF) TaxID=457570 RepID=B2A3C9_NATTJ|nr:hypothetical protein [Natranaerobius thermophilus]ACB86358.1 hypothetical protein Nther_2810 [Natranaerobius thermophilus JW/NM-WN-LF]
MNKKSYSIVILIFVFLMIYGAIHIETGSVLALPAVVILGVNALWNLFF